MRPVAVATCDLDSLMVAGETPFPAPIALGHECVAEVVEVGDGVRGVQPGAPRERAVPGLLRRVRRVPPRAHRQLPHRPALLHVRLRAGGVRLGRIPLRRRAGPVCGSHAGAAARRGSIPLAVASASDNIADAWRTVGPPLERDPGAAVLVMGGAGSGLDRPLRGRDRRGAGRGAGGLRRRRRGPARDRGGLRRRGPGPHGRATGTVPDHRGRERRCGAAGARAALHRARRHLHEHGHLLRRAAGAAAAGDVYEVHHVRHRPRSCPAGDPARAAAGGRRRSSTPSGSPRAWSTGTTRPPPCSSATG